MGVGAGHEVSQVLFHAFSSGPGVRPEWCRGWAVGLQPTGIVTSWAWKLIKVKVEARFREGVKGGIQNLNVPREKRLIPYNLELETTFVKAKSRNERMNGANC